MTLSTEALHEYTKLPHTIAIARMIDDLVDTNIIMDRVRAYGKWSRDHGILEGLSRASCRPGDGDMGG